MAMFHIIAVVIAGVFGIMILYLYVYPNMTTQGTPERFASFRRERPLIITDWGIGEVTKRTELGDGWFKLEVLNNDNLKEVMRLHETEISSLSNRHNLCGSGRPIWILASMKKKNQDIDSLMNKVKEYEHEKDFYQNQAGLRNADIQGEIAKRVEDAEKLIKSSRSGRNRMDGGVV